jgi:hypothetical protein
MAYVIARHGSYGSHDPVRKGGSDEGEEKPENRAVVMLDTEGCIFLPMINVRYSCTYVEAVFGPLGYM